MLLNVHALVQNAHDDNVVPYGSVKDQVTPSGRAAVALANVVTHDPQLWIGSQALHHLVKRAKVFPGLIPTPCSLGVAADPFQVPLGLRPNQVCGCRRQA